MTDAKIRVFRTGPEWCAEVWVGGKLLGAEYGASRILALEVLWRNVAASATALNAGLSAVTREVYREDPWREWRYVTKKVVGWCARIWATR